MKKIQFIIMVNSLFWASYAQAEPKKEFLSVSNEIIITKVNPIKMDLKDLKIDKDIKQQCKKWKLTKKQIIRFFRLSKNYANNPYNSYYQIPCDITGKLIYNKKEWNFSINGGATAYWEKNKEIKYFGCKDKQCDDLVILPTDMMNPE